MSLSLKSSGTIFVSRFLEALHSDRVLLMDGAMGTELQRAGLATGDCGELWNVTHPDKVRQIHEAYLAAGAECLLTNTFQSNPAALARHGAADRFEAINEAALGLARSAAGGPRFVIADIGPIAAGESEPELADPNVLRLIIGTLLTADAVLLETWSDPVALLAVPAICGPLQEMSGLPTLLSVAYERRAGGLWSRSGHPPEWFAMQAKNSGIAALGVNCGRDVTMDDMIEIVRRYRQVTDLPILARPNAGTPERAGERWVYPRTPVQMAERLPELLGAGVRLVGGCCGTSPEHIAEFRPIVERWNAERSGPAAN
jgi:5-methyltetrahydrofolate--homocysteine methyltransferase